MKKVILYILFLTSCPLVAQELPLVIQGVLKNSDGTALPEGKYTLTFRLYLSNEGDAQAIWEEIQSNVSLRDGGYSVELGSVTPLRLPFDRPYFLGVSLGGEPEFIPRSELTAAPAALFASRGGGGVEPGMIAPFAGYLAKIPYGWFPCDGRAVKSTDYPALFAVIGTTYGNGSSGAGAGGGTDFNLPDLNNQFLRGLNAGRISGVDRALGSREVFATGRPRSAFSTTTSSAGAHTHGYNMLVNRVLSSLRVTSSSNF
ncbi:MAG: phage tail protein, partial [Haliscomenobacter sp.]